MWATYSDLSVAAGFEGGPGGPYSGYGAGMAWEVIMKGGEGGAAAAHAARCSVLGLVWRLLGR